MSNYNTRPEAAEVMIYNGAIHILRPRRSVDDLETRTKPFQLSVMSMPKIGVVAYVLPRPQQ